MLHLSGRISLWKLKTHFCSCFKTAPQICWKIILTHIINTSPQNLLRLSEKYNFELHFLTKPTWRIFTLNYVLFPKLTEVSCLTDKENSQSSTILTKVSLDPAIAFRIFYPEYFLILDFNLSGSEWCNSASALNRA